MTILSRALKIFAPMGVGAFGAAIFAGVALYPRIQQAEDSLLAALDESRAALHERDTALLRMLALEDRIATLDATHTEEIISMVLEIEEHRAEIRELEGAALALQGRISQRDEMLAALGEENARLDKERGQLARVNGALERKRKASHEVVMSLMEDISLQKDHLADAIYQSLENQLQVEICGPMRSKTAQRECAVRLSVDLQPHYNDVKRCVMSGQMVPLVEVRHQSTPLSANAVVMGSSDSFNEVDLVLCDEMLPEAANPAPGVTESARLAR